MLVSFLLYVSQSHNIDESFSHHLADSQTNTNKAMFWLLLHFTKIVEDCVSNTVLSLNYATLASYSNLVEYPVEPALLWPDEKELASMSEIFGEQFAKMLFEAFDTKQMCRKANGGEWEKMCENVCEKFMAEIRTKLKMFWPECEKTFLPTESILHKALTDLVKNVSVKLVEKNNGHQQIVGNERQKIDKRVKQQKSKAKDGKSKLDRKAAENSKEDTKNHRHSTDLKERDERQRKFKEKTKNKKEFTSGLSKNDEKSENINISEESSRLKVTNGVETCGEIGEDTELNKGKHISSL